MCRMAHNRLHLYVPDDTLALLDARRGPSTRSAYVRWLIEQERPDEIQVQTFDGRIVRTIPSSSPASGDPVRPNHEHTWARAGSIFDRCDCGETRKR